MLLKYKMDTLCSIEIGDIGKGFYKADDIFKANSKVSTFRDTESGINENDLITLVTRIVDVIKGHGTILADTYSYDYDSYPQICYYNGGEVVSKLLDVDGNELDEEIEISDVSAWIQFVEDAEEIEDFFDEEN